MFRILIVITFCKQYDIHYSSLNNWNILKQYENIDLISIIKHILKIIDIHIVAKISNNILGYLIQTYVNDKLFYIINFNNKLKIY